MARLRREGDKMVLEIQLTKDEEEFLIELETFQGIVDNPEEPLTKLKLINLHNNGLIEDRRTRAFRANNIYISKAEITQEGREYLNRIYGKVLA